MSRLSIRKLPEFWSPSQRGVVIAFILIFSGALLYRVYANRQYVSNPPPAHGARYEELADRLDPNTASWQDLAAIPQLGQKRAKAIVAARESWHRLDPHHITYAKAEDLLIVPGIGAAMVENLRPYLMFPGPDARSEEARGHANKATTKKDGD